MSLSIFPAELLTSICDHLRDIDLVSVARTDSSLCAVAQRLLYRHISLTMTSENRSVVSTLANRPDIARFVRTFSLTAYGEDSEFHSVLSSAVSGMSEITSLDLLIDPEASWALDQRGPEGVTYPHLRHFTCSFPFDQNVINFLHLSPGVTQLEVNAASAFPLPTVTRLPCGFLPDLSNFQGPSHIAALIVPGRPVEALYLSSGIVDDSVITQLAKASSPIVLFDAISSSGLLSSLEMIANNMPSLVYLRLMTTRPFDDNPDPVYLVFICSKLSTDLILQSFYEQVSKALGRIPELTSFEFSGMNWTSWLASDRLSSDGKRIWQSRPPSPLLPSSDIREDDERFFGFTENFLLF